MTTVVIDIPKELYQRIAHEAQQQQLPIDTVIRTWLTERSASPSHTKDLWNIRATLQAAGPVSYTHLDVYKRQRLHYCRQRPSSWGY